jgi:hypothetical protein
MHHISSTNSIMLSGSPVDSTTSLLVLRTLARLFLLFSCTRNTSSVMERVLAESAVRS